MTSRKRVTKSGTDMLVAWGKVGNQAVIPSIWSTYLYFPLVRSTSMGMVIMASIKPCLIRLSNDRGPTLLPPPPPHVILSHRCCVVTMIRKAVENLLAIPASQDGTTSALSGGRFPLYKAAGQSLVMTYRSHLGLCQWATRMKRMLGRVTLLSTPDLLALPKVPPVLKSLPQRNLKSA
ncbi:hypothetical protein BKA61DRAFT_620912 [Leptodontidium sp. MPI-SDFR-AT-0119]|nr:hypothetical protein BKA61DRAFT_620912 [Leptodontidium sp. MPI-SDFR-AT-0119]